MGSCCSGQERVEPDHEREVWQENAIILSNSYTHHIRQMDVPLFQVAVEADYFCITDCIYHLQSVLFCATKSIKNPFYKNYHSTV